MVFHAPNIINTGYQDIMGEVATFKNCLYEIALEATIPLWTGGERIVAYPVDRHPSRVKLV